jgi:hypothetical protein
MRSKIVAIWLSFTVLFSALVVIESVVDFIPTASGGTLYVNKTGSDRAYTNIQDAIDNARYGDTVYVYPGTYFENLRVKKIINLTGEGYYNTKINGNGFGDVISVSEDWVNISGFTVVGAGNGPDDEEIELNDAQNCSITNCRYSPYIVILPPNYTNITPPRINPIIINYTNISIVPYPFIYNITNISYPFISTPWNTYTHPLLNYTVKEQQTLQGTRYTIKIENPPYFDIDDLSVFTDVKIIQYDQKVTIFEVYDTQQNSFLVRNLEELLLTKPYAPTSLSARPGQSHISLSWESEIPDPCFPIKKYRIYRGTRPGEENLLVEIGDTTYYKDTSVKNGKTYYYRVSAVNAVGEGEQSQEVKATFKQTKDQEEPGYQHGKESVKTRMWLMLIWALVIAVFLIGAVLIFVDHMQTRR